MFVIPLDRLVQELRDDPFAHDGFWFVQCPDCERLFHIWPDRDGMPCQECGALLVAVLLRHHVQFSVPQ